MEQATARKRNTAAVWSAGAMLNLGDHTLGLQDLDQPWDIPNFKVTAHDCAHPLGFFRDRDQLALDHLVPERHRATHPDALLLGGRDLVADPFAGNLALELGEAEQHVEGQATHAGRGVEGLGRRGAISP